MIRSLTYYPLLFRQNRKTLVWGTEDWVVSAIPNSESEVENGTWAQYNLNELIRLHPIEILGRRVAEKYHNQLPLLAKIIDTKRDLSIQVHPNDEMAMREHGKMGKSEMWYILDAEPGAYIYVGFKEPITPEEFQKIINNSKEEQINGSINGQLMGINGASQTKITDILAKHTVAPGDVFYLPAGRVHAIGGGIRLVEIQQSSDVTYRIFDYNRPGLDGRPRELHTELAAKAIDYTVYPEYRTPSPAERENRSKPDSSLLDTPYFSINVVESTEPVRRNMVKYDSFVILMNLSDECRIRVRATGDEITLPANASCLIPACIADYDIIPQIVNRKSSNGKCLEAFIR